MGAVIRLSRKVLLLVSIPVVFELGTVAVLCNLMDQAKEDMRKAERSRQVVGLLNSALVAHTERMQWLYLAKAQGFPKATQKVAELGSKSGLALAKVREMAEKNPGESEVFLKVADMIEGLTEFVKLIHQHYDEGQKEMAAREWLQIQNRIDAVSTLTDDFFLEQTNLQKEKQQALELKERAIGFALAASTVVSILTAFGLAYLFNRSTSDRLQVIMENTSRIAAGKAPLGLVGGDDELSRIDRLYHQMYADLVGLREKERALLDNAAELICSIDSNLRVSDINLSAEKILGFAQHKLVGLRVLDLIESNDQERAGTALEEAFDKTAPARFACKMKRDDGTIIDTEWVTTAAAKKDTIYCVIQDVTQKNLIEQMRRDFVAMVSHDLRTPLTSIQLTLSLAQEEAEAAGASKENVDGLTMAQNSANRLLALVNNLLDMEKLESGIFELQAYEGPLRPLLSEATASVENLARQKKIRLAVEAPQDATAFFDSERIAQVIINLISNGIKFSPKDSTITVSATRNKDFVRINISDQGRGIPPEMRSQIFERFKQVSPQDQYQMKGTGLGLAICKAIVERHMGEIGVSANGDRPGSTFWFTLPLNEDVFMRRREETKRSAIG